MSSDEAGRPKDMAQLPVLQDALRVRDAAAQASDGEDGQGGEP
jgi:hypothetical protein